MIRFEETKVMNLDGALRGMRNSWESWEKSDSMWWAPDPEEDAAYLVGPEDLKLAMKLSRAGSDHGKYLRQILVCVDIIAPEYWWREMDTYKVGTVANSTSQMHKLGSRDLTFDDFSFDVHGTGERILVENINELRANWLYAGGKKPSPEWRRMIQAVPQSFNYRRTFTANYQVLKSIYHSRKGHRLAEWEGFREWVRSLPYSQIITLEDDTLG